MNPISGDHPGFHPSRSLLRRVTLLEFLALLFLAGIVISALGATVVLSFGSQGVVDNTRPLSNSITMGWSPNNGEAPVQVVITLAPLINGGTTSEMFVDFYHAPHPNYSVTEALLTPFHVIKMGQTVGDWSFANAGDNGSILEAMLSANIYQNPVSAYFEFTNLTYSSDHGLYQITLPLTPRINYLGLRSAYSQLHLPSTFQFYGGVESIISVYLSDRDPITSSIPAYKVEPPQPYFESATPMNAFYYDLPANNSAPVVFGYTSTDEVGGYQRDQNLGFLALGIGVPLVISSLVEVLKERTWHDPEGGATNELPVHDWARIIIRNQPVQYPER